MQIQFQKKKIGVILNDKRKCKKTFGERADVIMLRLSQLAGAPNLAVFDKPPLKGQTGFHQLTGDRKGQYAVTVIHPFRLVFYPVPHTGNLSSVEEIKIDDILNYHD